MIKLGVNIDHIATLRQARGGVEPSVLHAAYLAEANGADSITVHLREDRRHIQDEDVLAIRKSIRIDLNLEMSIDEEIVQVALKVKPYQVTLVPEKREELTTEGGLDVLENVERIRDITKRLKEAGIQVSLFIDPEEPQVEASKQIGADCVELHTGEYANAGEESEIRVQFDRLLKTSHLVNRLGLTLNAGHGLNYQNVKRICALPDLNELNIGHSIISHAVFVGLGRAIGEMKTLLR